MANRVTTWSNLQVLTDVDLNGEFNNIWADVTHTVSGTWTFNKSGTPITIQPGSAPAANTNLLVVNDASGNNMFRADSSGIVTIGATSSVQAKFLVSGSWTTTSNAIGAWISPVLNPAADGIAELCRIDGTIVEAGSGTHIFNALGLHAPAVTAGAALVSNTAMLYIDSQMGAVVTGANYAIWVDDGTTRLDGALEVRGVVPSSIGGTTISNRLLTMNGTSSVLAVSLDISTNFTIPISSDAYGIYLAPNFTEAASGTHSLIAGLSVVAGTITAGAALVTNTAEIYVSGPMTATVTGVNYAMWIDDGVTRLDGPVDFRNTTQTTIGANGAASALTANPVGYLQIQIAGVSRIIPYYNP